MQREREDIRKGQNMDIENGTARREMGRNGVS